MNLTLTIVTLKYLVHQISHTAFVKGFAILLQNSLMVELLSKLEFQGPSGP